MIIELFGPPSAGKTTLAHFLSEKENFEIIKIRSKKELLFFNFLYLFRHPIKFFATLFYLLANSSNWRIFYYKFLNTFLHYNAKYQKAKKYQKAILDQGHLQNILSVFEKPLSTKRLNRYLKFLPRPDKLIIFNLRPEELEKRAQSRGYLGRENFGQDYQLKWKDAFLRNFNLFKEAAPCFGIDFKIIDANMNLDENCQRVLGFIKINLKKLLYITNARIPTEKAHGLQIIKMCEAFAKTGLAVELIIPSRINSIRNNPFQYYGVKEIFGLKKIFSLDLFKFKILPNRLNFYIQSFSFAANVFLKILFTPRKKDIIFYSRDYLILFLFCLMGLDAIAEIHDYKSSQPKWWLGFIAKKVKKIITNSEGTKNFLREHYNVSDDKFIVAPNGVDIDFFDIKESTQEARHKLNLSSDKTIISYIGRLETLGMEKGVSDLIRSFAQLIKNRQDVFLCVIGGPDNLISRYQQIADSLGINSSQILFTGQVGYNLIPLYLRAMDIVVVPFPATKQFAFTASPIKVFEFMAAGKVIIASDLPALRTSLSDKSALFSEPGNIEDLSDKINFILENSALAKEMSERVLEDARQYTWSSRAEKIIKFVS
ncbi:MAG: glycosyltransferase [Candidatus Portnoybacteria bacterium]|nr:glycosyltransferase [Candidatus Portnoybacteria bacterium]